MKLLLGITIAISMMTSQASTNQNGSVLYGKPIATVAQQPIATQSVPARAKNKKIIKSKIQRYIPLNADEDDEIFVQEEDLATGYRRRDINRIEDPDDISESVRWRLFLARQLALLKYKQVWG